MVQLYDGNYKVQKEGKLVAYARVCAGTFYLTPNRISGPDLNLLTQVLNGDSEDHGFEFKPYEVKTEPFVAKKPAWGEMTVSPWKRQKWMKAKSKTELSGRSS